MTLYEKIVFIYPELLNYDFSLGGIRLQNDGDERGDFIAVWQHPSLLQPTKEQLDALEAPSNGGEVTQ